MTTSTRAGARRLVAAAVAVAALPVAMGPGRCGFLLDYTETILITEEVERVALDVDDGSIVATAYEREGVLIKRHTFGFEPSVDSETAAVDADTLKLEARCKYEGNCRFDHMLELPLGLDFSVVMADSQISLGYFDGDVEVTFESGWFKGVRLAAPNFTLALTTGDVTVDFAAVPDTISIEVGVGDVEVSLPPGAYNCALDSAEGQIKLSDVTCDAAARPVLAVTVQTGDISVTGSER